MKSEFPVLAAAVAGAHTAQNCSTTNLASVLPTNATFYYTKSYPAHYNFTPPTSLKYGLTSDPMGISAYELPVAACIAQANITLPNNTQHRVGLVLPEGWNGRFLANGNGEFSGSVAWDSIIDVSWYGTAVVSSDLGHEGNNGSFGYHNEQSLQNWGHFALHDAFVSGKALTEGYYGRKTSYSYRGCSAGGKQGLEEVEEYPEDFDGVIMAPQPGGWITSSSGILSRLSGICPKAQITMSRTTR